MNWLKSWWRYRYERRVVKLLRRIDMKTSELAAKFDSANTLLDKIGTEYGALKQAYIELKDVVTSNDPDLPPDVVAKFEEFETKLTGLDKITPDAGVGEPDPEIPTT